MPYGQSSFLAVDLTLGKTRHPLCPSAAHLMFQSARSAQLLHLGATVRGILTGCLDAREASLKKRKTRRRVREEGKIRAGGEEGN